MKRDRREPPTQEESAQKLEYKLASGYLPGFEGMINELLEEGWLILGQTTVISSETGLLCFQALIREKSSTGEVETNGLHFV